MTDIKRYDPDHDYGSCWMELHSSGDYVLFEDYESLESEMRCLQSDYNVLRRGYEALQAGLKKLCLES